VEKRQVTEVQELPFATRRVNDAALPKGTEKVRTAGVPGEKTLTYEVTVTGGVESERLLVSETITKQPVTQVVAVGTKQQPPTQQCHSSYKGNCVPIASDVDCAGGSGDGPAYVQGPVTVVGPDVYDLDRDGDGIGCE
jgi:resuscitation-promoting factor RpfB